MILDLKNKIKNVKSQHVEDSSMNFDTLNDLMSKIRDLESQLTFKTEIITRL